MAYYNFTDKEAQAAYKIIEMFSKQHKEYHLTSFLSKLKSGMKKPLLDPHVFKIIERCEMGIMFCQKKDAVEAFRVVREDLKYMLDENKAVEAIEKWRSLYYEDQL